MRFPAQCVCVCVRARVNVCACVRVCVSVCACTYVTCVLLSVQPASSPTISLELHNTDVHVGGKVTAQLNYTAGEGTTDYIRIEVRAPRTCSP